MISIINNNTTYTYSKFNNRPKWLINHGGIINSLLYNLLNVTHGDVVDKQNIITALSNSFQSTELLCKRNDLQFLNLRGYFSNLLKALHLCWLAARNNKRIFFIDRAYSIASNNRSQLIVQSLSKQRKRQSIPRRLISFSPLNQGSKHLTSHSIQDCAKLSKHIKKQKQVLVHKNNFNFSELLDLFSKNITNIHLNKNAAPIAALKVNMAVNNEKTGFSSNRMSNTKYQIKLRAKIAQQVSRQTCFFANASSPSFLSTNKNAFNASMLTHLDQFVQNATIARNYGHQLKEQIIFNTSKQKKLININKNNLNVYLLHLKTKPLKLYSIAYENVNIKNSCLPFFNGIDFSNISDLVNTSLLKKPSRVANTYFLESSNINSFYQVKSKLKEETLRKVIDPKIGSKFLNHFYKCSSSPNVKKMPEKNWKTQKNLVFKLNTLQKYYNSLVQMNNYEQSLNFVKNPWLIQADIIFFVDPEKNGSMVEQAKRLNIPTIGVISGATSNRFGRQGFRNYNFDNSVNYPIIGNSGSFFFTRMLLDVFIKTIQVATKNKKGFNIRRHT